MLSSKNLPIVIVACKVFQDLIQRYLPDGSSKKIIYMDYGLHRVPRNLRKALQEKIDQIEEPSLVVLGYGLCGNGLDGIRANQHILVVPRADDCIAILLGSYEEYKKEFGSVPGTYYLSKGWLESGSNPLQEYNEYKDKYGEQQAAWLMDLQYRNYERLALVVHNMEDLEKYRPQAREVAEYCAQWGMRYEEIIGSDRYVKRLMEVATALDKADSDFLVVPPGGDIRQEKFFRMNE